MHTYIAPTLFGLEGIAAGELRRLNIANVRAADGRVCFDGDTDGAATALVNLATAERVCILAAEFEATSFETLYDGVAAVDWASLLPRDAAFPVRGHCLSSKLMSVPDCRSIIKKAVATRLGAAYGIEQLPEDGALYQLRFNILRDRASVMLDITGASLHKRGYRAMSGEAPLRETVAAGMLSVARYNGAGAFRDPFCGSGTIAIEAALRAKGRAVGLNRGFALEYMSGGAEALNRAREAAREREVSIAAKGKCYDIAGSDIDPAIIELARQNAKAAGVGELVRFDVCDALTRPLGAPTGEKRGTILINPPYGERLSEHPEAASLMRDYGALLRRAKPDGWAAHILSPEPELEKLMGLRSASKRKMYNGTIKCDLYSFNVI